MNKHKIISYLMLFLFIGMIFIIDGPRFHNGVTIGTYHLTQKQLLIIDSALIYISIIMIVIDLKKKPKEEQNNKQQKEKQKEEQNHEQTSEEVWKSKQTPNVPRGSPKLSAKNFHQEKLKKEQV